MWTLPTTTTQAAIDPLRNPPINEDLAIREVQRQQAIQDLEALLQPGALEARIQKVCVFFYFTNRCLREHLRKV